MVRLIQKSSFIKAGRAGGYMKYIATREGVERITKDGPVSKEQRGLIASILKDYPDTKKLFEYEDYRSSPSLKTASAFISMALDCHVQDENMRDGYMKYIAMRPGAELHGTHGLFSKERDTDLDSALEQLNMHRGNVWTIIYSLRREDAVQHGYDHANGWRELILRHEIDLAESMKVRPGQLHWYAAFHDEGSHPHIHMMLWSDNPQAYDAAEQARSAKRHPSKKTEAQVLLRKLCGHSVTKTIEQQVLTCLNRLINNPNLLNAELPSVNALRIVELQRELDRVMQVQPVNEEKARELICQLASAQYESLGCGEYETIRLKHLLLGTEPMRELDAGLLGASVQKVIVTKTGVSLLMKNGQLILGDEVS